MTNVRPSARPRPTVTSRSVATRCFVPRSTAVLRGTKHRVATEREVTVGRGRADGRTFVIVPEVKGNTTTGLTLLHARFHDRLPADRARRVLQGYRGRYAAIE